MYNTVCELNLLGYKKSMETGGSGLSLHCILASKAQGCTLFITFYCTGSVGCNQAVLISSSKKIDISHV